MSDGEPWRALAADLRRAGTPAGRHALGAFTIEGWRLVERALAAGSVPRAALVADGLGEDTREHHLATQLRQVGCEVVVAPASILADLVGGRSFGDILAVVDLTPGEGDLTHALAKARLALAVHAVQDPGNLGALWRTALVSGCDALVVVGGSDPYHPKAVRASMGAVFRLPLFRVAAPEQLLAAGRVAGMVQLGAVSAGGEALPEVQLDGARALVWMGSEAFGLPASISAAMDRRVTIPMAPRVDSLSVNAAAAVVLYQLRCRPTG